MTHATPSERIGLDEPVELLAAEVLACAADEQQRFVQHLRIHSLLPLALETKEQQHHFTERVHTAIIPNADAFTRDVVERIAQSADNRDNNKIKPTKLSWWRITARTSAVAALLAIAIWVTSDGTAVATLLRSESATWQQPLSALTPGCRLQLQSGLAEFDLHGRGTLLLEGPADIIFHDDMHATLQRGRIVAHINPSGHGYTVTTPSGKLIDLGTQFGVSVNDEGVAEAHVITGSITAQINSSDNPTVLKTNDAVRLRKGELEKMIADPGAFYTALPPLTSKPDTYIRWRLDENNGNIAHADGNDASSTTDLRLLSLNNTPLPQWVPGQFGSALSFHGNGAYAESDFPGIGGKNARTVACWIRMPNDFTDKDGFGIVSWGHFSSKKKGAVWQLSLNPLVQDGPMGRVRIGTHGGWLVGSTDLRDDSWHHVAIVMYGGSQPNIGTHVLVYVDGQLERISKRTLRVIDTDISDKNSGVWLGRNIVFTKNAQQHPLGQEFMRGAIDDIVITNTALSQKDIKNLMSGN